MYYAGLVRAARAAATLEWEVMLNAANASADRAVCLQ